MIGHDDRRQGLPVFMQIAEFEDGAQDLRIVQRWPTVSDTEGDEISYRLIERQPNGDAWGGAPRVQATKASKARQACRAAIWAAAQEKLQKLSAGQIRTKIAGMELTDEVHWRELYGRSGTVTSDSMGRKRPGKWRVEKEQLCIEFDKEPPAKCYEVWMSGKKVELRREGSCRCKGSSNRPRAANSPKRSLRAMA